MVQILIKFFIIDLDDGVKGALMFDNGSEVGGEGRQSICWG